ncbi:related to monosaccharide transporter [Cephalotrichum gorgonifer]|uniref:Related to monosaccharide transporter n=1 Tax=Cephalotrichum gorgonifer TaxID=2041049 RepID=A0AAE8SUS1_9PEZI|nr:related to monosaccharide transporter [Cephalotrichum gorgonifer]
MAVAASDTTPNLATRENLTTWHRYIRTIIFCAIVSTATLQYGLDISIINAAQALKGFLKVFGHPNPKAPQGYGIAPSFQQSITSLMNVGVIVGSFSLDFFSQHLGRRRCFIVGSLAGIGANLILILATNKSAIIFARFLFGVSNGLYIGFTSIYISEASPSHLRGSLVTFVQVSVCIGTVIGAVVNNATKHFESRLSYQIPLFTLFVIPVFCMIMPFFIPESPRWLLLKGRREEARTHLYRMRGSSFPAELIDAEMVAIEEAIEAEKENTIRGWGALRLMFSDAERRRTLLTIASGTMHGASGFPFISSYKTYFFQIAGSQRPFVDSIIVTTVSLIGAVSGVFLNRFVGRRPLLIFGFSVQAILMLVIGVVWTVSPGTITTGKVIVAMVIIFQCLYACIVGPVSWVVASEVPSTRLRATTFGLGNGVGFLAYFLIAFTTPYFINPEALNIGPKVGYIWLGSNLITATFIFFFLPETHRRSLENIDEMFYNKVPARKFKSYQCTGVVQVAEEGEKSLTIESDSGATSQHQERPSRET